MKKNQKEEQSKPTPQKLISEDVMKNYHPTYFEAQQQKVKILPRNKNDNRNINTNNSNSASTQKSLEQRQKEYEEARKRIMGQQT